MRHSIILLSVLFSLGLVLGPAGPTSWLGPRDAYAQGKKRGKTAKAGESQGKGDKGSKKVKVFDFTGLDVAGQLRAPQLLYFLDRANEELRRASLERRSFIPEMVRSIDEESL